MWQTIFPCDIILYSLLYLMLQVLYLEFSHQCSKVRYISNFLCLKSSCPILVSRLYRLHKILDKVGPFVPWNVEPTVLVSLAKGGRKAEKGALGEFRVLIYFLYWWLVYLDFLSLLESNLICISLLHCQFHLSFFKMIFFSAGKQT